MSYDGYLSFGGNEILNTPRAVGISQSADCPAFWLKNNWCLSLRAALGDSPYTHANIQDAPWYDPANAEVSSRFYGAYGIDISGLKDSNRQTQVTEGLSDGGVIGSSREGVKRVRVRAVLLARGDDALEYGRAWLASALKPNACGQHGDECGTTDVEFFAACPPDRGAVTGFTDWVERARNYIPTPSFEGFENAGGFVPAYENLALNPRAVVGGAASWIPNNVTTNPATRVTSFPVPHPLGFTTGVESSSTGTNPMLASLYNVDGLGSTGSPERSGGMWILVTEAGYATTGSWGGTPLPANIWVFVRTSTPVAAGSYAQVGVNRISGTASTTARAYFTAAVYSPGPVPVRTYFDGDYRPRIRVNRAIRPIASDGWTMYLGGEGTQLLSVIDDARFGGEKARKSETLTAGTVGYVFPGSTVNGIQVGDIWTFSMKYATQGYSGAEPTMALGGALPPLFTTLGSGSTDNGDGTKTAWRTVQITEARSGSADPILTGFGARPAGMTLLAGEALWEQSATLGEWFSGDTPQAPGFAATWEGTANASRSYIFDTDFTPGWSGTANASSSILFGVEALGLLAQNAVAILSTRWSKFGSRSLRLIAKGGGVTMDTFARAIVPVALRGGGTFLATSYLEEPVVGASSLVGEIMVAVPITEKKRANVAGEVDLRLTYGALTSTYNARFYHGGPEGSADVWFDCAGLFAGNYEGPWFDGNLTAPGDPELARYRWTGVIGNSESVYETRERTERPQTDEEWAASIDEGRRFLHGVGLTGAPFTVQQMRQGPFVGDLVEFTLTAERPWVTGITRSVDLPRTQSSVVEDVRYNLIPHPSMELPAGDVVIADNLAPNPSVETNATGWSAFAGATTGANPAPYATSGRSTELAAVGAASFRHRLLGNGSTAAVGRAEMLSFQDVPLAGLPARGRVSVGLWGALIKAAGAASTSLVSMDARVEWRGASGAISTVIVGTATPSELSGKAFSAKSLLPPAGATTARVILRGVADWESSATPANNSDIRLYADALAVTIP